MFAAGKRMGVFALSGIASVALVACGASASPERIERGRYLVERASVCIDCHTPMDAKGMPDRARWMQGSPIFFKPTVKVPAWADMAPPLAGLVGYTDAQIVRAIQTGVSAAGYPLRPPMPPYRFSKEDADAIVAFLRTLKPATAAGPKR
jgi:mono/diheme cytochrome c family protein